MQIASPSVRPSSLRKGFTLVEVLVVIVIIGMLAAIAIPATMNVITKGKMTAMRAEAGGLESAVQAYLEKYGDYPPDFSDWTVVELHYRKIFPRIQQSELNRLRLLTDINSGNDTAVTMPSPFPAHDGARMDRAEALVWSLGGFSSDIQFPFTGQGGPLELVSSTGTAITYHINTERDNALRDFDAADLDLGTIAAGSITPTNRYLSSDGDLFLQVAAASNGAPYVYFDSRTYGFQATYFSTTSTSVESDFNGYGSTSFGVVRPFLSDVRSNGSPSFATLATALQTWQFVKPDSFQILAPGTDGLFGSVAGLDVDGSVSGNTENDEEPLYFQYPSGNAVLPLTTGASPAPTSPASLIHGSVRGYQITSLPGYSSAENSTLDNLGTFCAGRVDDDVPQKQGN